jgi:hypothetical protein
MTPLIIVQLEGMQLQAPHNYLRTVRTGIAE